jgi:hypothetical protein
LIDTDLVVGIFDPTQAVTWATSFGKTWTADYGTPITNYVLETKPSPSATTIVDPQVIKSTDNKNMFITLERWDVKNNTCILSTTQALQQLFEAIKANDDDNGFNWSTMNTYFTGVKYPPVQITIRFANAVFTIQDVHDLTVGSNGLTKITLFGHLVVHDSGQCWIAGSHKNKEKYAAAMACKISLTSTTSSWIISNTTLTKLPDADL